MPGNGVGDRIHNFFGQENLSQGQQRSQGVDRTWPTLNQGQIETALISNLKNHNLQQSADSESGHGGQPSGVQHDVNFSQPSSLRSEFARYQSQSQSQQPALNGYMHGHQVFHARQNESNFMGMASESDRHNLTSRGFSVFDSQLGNGSELHQKNSGRMDFTESPVNYDFFGGQQQMNSQQPVMMQSLPRQQPGIRDMEMLRQQFLLRQMQEIQRQQQFPQQEARQLNSVNQVSSFAEQAAGSHSMAMINGIPIHDTSNYSWKPELMAANAHWSQRGVSPFVHGSSGGVIFSPDQVQASHLLGMVPQQVDQSLHGVPISGTRVTSSQYSPIQMDKSTIQQIQGSNASLQGNQYIGFSNQVSMYDGALASRQGYQGKNMIETADGQGLNCGINLENMQQLTPQHCNTLRQEVACPSETSQNKTEMQVSSSQNAATLDPTEEKILFGSDDSVWEGFGKSTNMLDGTDVFAFPSVQSGSWSALMQSAVAETSSGNGDAGPQEEWSGLNFQNNEPLVGNQQNPTLNEIGKQQSSWTNRLQTPSSSTSVNYNNIPFVKQPGMHEQNESLQACSSPSFTQHFPREQNKSFPQNSVAEGNNIFGKLSHSLDAESHAKGISGSWMNQQSLSSYNTGGQQSSRQNGWNFIDSMSPSMSNTQKNMGNENLFQASQSTDQKSSIFGAAVSGTGIWKTDPVSNVATKMGNVKSAIGSPRVDAEDANLNNVSTLPDSSTIIASGQQLSMSNNMDIWKRVDSSVYPKGADNTGKYQSQTDTSHQSFASSGNNSLRNGAIESHEMHNSNAKRSSTDIFHNTSHHSSAVDVKENSWQDASDSHTLSGGKPKSSSHIGRKPPGHKFQYHPMGDLDVDAEPSNRTKQLSHSQPMLQQVSEGFAGQSKFPSQVDTSYVEIEKGQYSSFHGDSKGLEGTPAKSMFPGSAPTTAGPFDRAVHSNSTKMMTPSSQNMLELFHKVDHSREHGNATQYSSSDHNQPSEMPEARISDGIVHFQRSMSYASKGNVPSEFGAYSLNSHGFATKEQMAKGELGQQVSEEKDTALATVSASQGKELTGPSLPNPSSTQREIEAFGRTLRPKYNLHQNYSLFHQMQSVKNPEVDAGNRSSKRFKGAEGAVDPPLVDSHAELQIYAHGNMVREVATSHISTSGDPKMLTFSAKQAVDRDTNAPSQDVFTFGQNDSQNISSGSNLASIRREQSHISPQMAPSWFDRFGTLKNGRIMPAFDAQKMAAMKSIELPLTIARPSDGLHAHDSMEQRIALAADAGQHGAVQKSSTASLRESENLSFPQLLHPNSANASLVVVQPKKRKSSIYELVPWHKEVTYGLRKLQNISEAEVDWSRAANRLPEKVEDEIEIVEDGLPRVRSKRRLILTTQLMQLLLCPPPASVLFADANSHHQSVAHFIARSTLGDACSALSFTGSDTLVPCSSSNTLSDKLKTPESIKDQFFSKVVEDLIGRAKNLENDLLRLDKRASVLDLRVECQDLEKFSVINRFAKFHGQGQSDGDAPANALKNCLQRYVIALPMPKNLPDRVPCLSL